METGDRLVQCKLNDSGAVVAQRVEKIVAVHKISILLFLGLFGLIILASQPLLAYAAVSRVLTTNPQLITKYCGDNPQVTGIGTAPGLLGVLDVGCVDASGLVGLGFNNPTRTALAVDLGGDPAALQTLSASDFETLSSTGALPTVGCLPWDVPCMGGAVLTFLASLIMSLAGMLLTVSGSLFDLLITHTVINFKGTLQSIGMLDSVSDSGATIIGPITQIWAVFRDVANILIIGMFVFMAISTILSLENYGYRKYLAKILIVAVLINFSMFFGKITIDVSNFVAREFYKTMPILNTAGQNSGTTVNATTDLEASKSISGTFMNDIGISGVWDWKYDQLSELTSNPSQGPLVMLSYSLGAALFMTVTAFTLLYGSFLLASRAILLVFILITSSLAFASMLLPGKFAEEAWGKWKNSLINSAVFAPLLMLFLAATLLVLNGAPNVRGENTLAEFLHDPTQVNGWSVLFVFIIASGMLYVSIRVANTFAGKIAGFNYAAAIPGLGLVAGSALASFGLRNTVGRAGANFAKYQTERAQRLVGEDKKFQAGMAHIMSGAGNLVGKQSFNTMKTGFGKGLAGVMGGEKAPLVGGFIKSANAAGKGGFIADRKKYNENLLKTAEAMAPTEKMQQKAREEALKNATPEQKAEINKAFEAELAAKSAATIAEKKKKDDLARIDREASKIINPPEEKAREMQEQVRMEALRASAPEVQVRHDELSKEEHALELQVEAQERANKKALQDFDNETKMWEGRVDTSYPGAALEMETRSQKRRALETTNIANMTPLQEGISHVKAQRGELIESVIPKAVIDQKIAEKRAVDIAGKAAEKRAATEAGDQAIKDTKKASEEAEKAHRKALATVVPMGALRTREENVADITHIRWQNTIPRIFGQTTENDSVAEDVRKGVKKKGEEKKIKDAFSGYIKEIESEKPKEDKPATDAKPAEESH